MKIEGKWIIILIVICIAVGIILGWNIKPSKTPKNIVTESIKSDSSKTPKHIEAKRSNIIKPKFIPIPKDTSSQQDTVKPKLEQFYKTYSDSLEGKDKGLGYKFTYKVIDSAGTVVSRMDAKFDWTEILVREQRQRDSTRVEVNTEYVTLPFFLDHWFYVALGSTAIVVLFVVKSLFGL